MSAETAELPRATTRVYRIRSTDAFGREVSTTVLGVELAFEMIGILREQGHKCRLAAEAWVR